MNKLDKKFDENFHIDIAFVTSHKPKEKIKKFYNQEIQKLIEKIILSEDDSGIELEKEADKFGVPVSVYAIRKLEVLKEKILNEHRKT